MMTVRLLTILIMFSLAVASLAAPPAAVTLKTKVHGRWLEGMPVAWSENELRLLGRDGRMWAFDPNQATEAKQTATFFRGYTAAQLRGRLVREFGKQFEVSGTGHYLVVHPAGQRDYWASRFEELHNSFRHYFSVRGLRLSSPKFPLVAIVFRQPGQMVRYARAEGVRIGRGVLGYYSPTTNRVVMYDRGGGRASKQDWAENSATIIHEAAHQTAYNCGIHSRVAPTPIWVAEGLGTLFEAPGVWDSRRYPRIEQRINRGRLEDFRRRVAKQLSGAVLADFVASDNLFRSDASASYALAWTLTFYLVERQPRQYVKYLARTAARPALQQYPPQERTADFTTAFGRDFAMLSAKIQRFVADLK